MTKNPKVILFDADGVLIIPDELFSFKHARENGFDGSEITPFFKGDFEHATLGKADLKELLEKHRAIWRWEGRIDELMDTWFKSENKLNHDLIGLIAKMRGQGIKCYLATNQEKYRTKYIREVMFPDVFDKVFSSCEMNLKKPDPAYYEYILSELKEDGVGPNEVIYFDDIQENVDVASKLGIGAYLFQQNDDVTSRVS